MGITTELADQVHLQCTDAIDELLFAEIAIRDQVLERLELLRRHDAFTMGQIGIDTALLRIVVQRRGGLFHAEHIGAVCVTSTQASVAISKPSTERRTTRVATSPSMKTVRSIDLYKPR